MQAGQGLMQVAIIDDLDPTWVSGAIHWGHKNNLLTKMCQYQYEFFFISQGFVTLIIQAVKATLPIQITFNGTGFQAKSSIMMVEIKEYSKELEDLENGKK